MLETSVGGLVLKNPIMPASGTFGYGLEMQEWVDLRKLGAIVTKGLSLKPIIGNPPPRIVETPCGMLNAIGLENIGVETFINDKLPILREFGVPIIANIFATSYEDFQTLSSIISGERGISALEINVSCPNVHEGGIHFGTSPKGVEKVVSRVKKKAGALPVWVKLSPNVTSITDIVRAAKDGGADAVVLINTFPAMMVDVKTRSPLLANITGGLSGPAIKPISLKLVWEVANKCNIDVVGVGGILTAEDVLEFLLVGAKAVQIGSATFRDPTTIESIIGDLPVKMKEYKIDNVRDFIGTLEVEEVKE